MDVNYQVYISPTNMMLDYQLGHQFNITEKSRVDFQVTLAGGANFREGMDFSIQVVENLV
jgi:hypothetical protein